MIFVVFQSHLYGIESIIIERHIHHDASFNRTFMELKVPDAIEGTRGGAKFQSHLYGIESNIILGYAQLRDVSIAPLWN